MTRHDQLVAAGLIVLGSLTMIGDVFRIAPVRALGLATAASPAPKVFTAQDGFETYANRFFLDYFDADGVKHEVELTPAVYGNLAGPYNRRNVYGAVVSYSPVLAANPVVRPMFRTVLERAFCREHPITVELGVPKDAALHGPVTIRLQPRGRHQQVGFALEHEVRCHD